MSGFGGASRSARMWTRVDNVTDVRQGDVLSYHSRDGEWREGKVNGRAFDTGHDPAWWVDQALWSGNLVDLTQVLVARAWNGCLHEVLPVRATTPTW